ncbi:MAG: hypothetical protein ABIW84_02085 [Ilumatobacteraceae bacterium]
MAAATSPDSPQPAPIVVARVVPDLTGLDRQFDYLVPSDLADRIRIGTSVGVPLNSRRVKGWVVALGPPDPARALGRLLPITKIAGIGPSAEVVRLARWAARRWAGRLRPFLVAASPQGVVLATPPAHHGATVSEGVDERTSTLLGLGGGVLRLAPATDLVPVILAAYRLGPTLVVTPAVAEGRVLAARLRRCGLTVAVLPHEWASAAGGVDVVLGARAAVWGPCPNLASIVVVDEHDESLQEQRQPTWHGRDVAIERARRAGVPVLLVSPCPSATAVTVFGPGFGPEFDPEFGPANVSRPTVVDERNGWPIVEIVDRTKDDPWQKSLITSALIRQVRDPLRTVICVLNTTGRSRLLACRRCRSLQRCEVCEAAVAQRDDSNFECARCGTLRPPVCQACGASAFANLRIGVTRLREELEAAAGRPVVSVTGKDTDTEGVAAAGIYVGTEAALHRVRNANTVAFLDFDAELLAPRYRATEQSMALLARAARLVGGRTAGGRLLVQTFLPHHEVLDAALHADPGRLMGKELQRRRELGFPPFAAIAVVSGAGAEAYARGLAPAGVQWAPNLDGNVLLRAATWDVLGNAIAEHPRPKGARIRIEIDPSRL